MQRLEIYDCDLEFLDFSFFIGFVRLTDLTIEYTSNLGKAKWAPIFSMPRLRTIKVIDDSSALNSSKWASQIFPTFASRLEEVSLDVKLDGIKGFGDEITDRTLQWLFNSSTSKSLQMLQMLGTTMTRIPLLIFSFEKLNKLILSCSGSEIKTINFLNFIVPAEFLSIEGCGIAEIMPGTFQGIYR